MATQSTKSKTRTFTYETKSGAEIEAPYFEDAMNAGFIRRHRNDSVQEQMFALVEEALSPEALEAFDTLGPSEMGDFYTAWQEDAGITAGE